MLRTSRLTVGLGMAVVVVALLACKKKEESSSSGAAASGDSIGVPECDEYLTKYEKCLKEKIPAIARPQMEESFKKTRETYKTLASNPTTKAGMPATCKQALEATKTAMGSYGCTW